MEIGTRVLAWRFLEDTFNHVDGHLHCRIPDGVDPELPAQLMGPLGHPVEAVFGNSHQAVEIGHSLPPPGGVVVRDLGPEGGSAQPTVDAHLDGANLDAVVSETGMESQSLQLGDGCLNALLQIVMLVKSRTEPQLDSDPGEFLTPSLIGLLKESQIPGAKPGHVEAGVTQAGEGLESSPQIHQQFLVVRTRRGWKIPRHEPFGRVLEQVPRGFPAFIPDDPTASRIQGRAGNSGLLQSFRVQHHQVSPGESHRMVGDPLIQPVSIGSDVVGKIGPGQAGSNPLTGGELLSLLSQGFRQRVQRVNLAPPVLS